MAKPKLFIHIGLGKTGTTSLQNYFWRNRDALKAHGVIYPHYGVVSCAHHLLSPHRPPFLATIGTFIDPAVWAPKLARRSEGCCTLLSSEIISSLNAAAIPAFAATLREHFETRVIVYVRRIDNLMMAAYNQQIKAGTQRVPIEDCTDALFERLRFDKRLMPWVTEFGQDCLEVRVYERRQLTEGDICKDFLLRTFGITDHSDFSMESVNSNPRLSYSALEFKRALNNVILDTAISAGFNRLLLEYSAREDQGASAIFQESNILPNAVRSLLIRAHATASEWIARDLMNRPNGQLFFDPEPDERQEWSLPDVEEGFRAIGELINASDLRRVLLSQVQQCYDQPSAQRYFHAMKLMPYVVGRSSDR